MIIRLAVQLLVLLTVLALARSPLKAESAAAAAGPFQPTWASLGQHQTPAWFGAAKFGIWAHWGPQAAPEAGDWYARNLYLQGQSTYQFHIQHFGHPSEVGFKDIIPLWKAEKFDPDALMAVYKAAGARYFVALACHHDNFDCWDSTYQPWNSVHLGPHKDIVGLWKQAAQRQGMPFGVSIHNINVWGWYDPARGADATGPKAGVPYDGLLSQAAGQGKWWQGYDPADLYGPPHRPGPDGDQPTSAFMANWFRRTRELIDKYQPDLLAFDLASPKKMWRQWVQFEDATNRSVESMDEHAGMLIAEHYYNQECHWHGGTNAGIITLKTLPPERRAATMLAIERDYSATILDQPWQLEESMGDWFYQAKGHYINAAQVLAMLVETVCRNGNLLLNVVQKPDGTLAGDQATTLRTVGDWLAVNGEAIYGSQPWHIPGEGPSIVVRPRGSFNEVNQPRALTNFTALDIRFTTQGSTLYAITLGPPPGEVTIKALAGEPVTAVRLLGTKEPLTWHLTPAGLVIQRPPQWPGHNGVVFKITGAR